MLLGADYPAASLRYVGTVLLWVLRTRPAEDPVPSYDVFDSFGKQVGRVVLPKDTRLAGFGQRSVYLVRRDADDLEYLQRYAL